MRIEGGPQPPKGKMKRKKARKVAPDDDIDLEGVPPESCADRYIFMPVLVCQRTKEHFENKKNYIRSFWMSKRKGWKARIEDFVESVMLHPDHFKLPFENIHFPSKDGVILNGFLVAMDPGKNYIPTIILFHGNAGNIGDNLPWVTAMFDEILCNIFLFDYRGYGYSEGKPSEHGAYLDAQAAFDYVYNRPDLNPRYIILHGQSIGGAIALDLAVRKNYKSRVAGLIIENTFTSLSALLHQYSVHPCLRPFRILFKLLKIKHKFRNSAKIPHVICPVLVISSLKDSVIPPSHSAYLFWKCEYPKKQMYVDAEGEHMNAYLKDTYYIEIAKFLIDVIVDEKEKHHHPYSLVVRKSRQTAKSAATRTSPPPRQDNKSQQT